MLYTVDFATNGHYVVQVEANNVYEAEEKAQKKWEEEVFDKFEDIDGYIYSVKCKRRKEYKK